MAFPKTANAIVREPVLSPHDWENAWGGLDFHIPLSPEAKGFWKTASSAQSKYLLSHCTIMSSVATEEEPYDYLIRPASAHLVNNNDDAWSNDVMKMSHRTFVGAFNFVEHFQNSKYAKGHIIDSILRKIHLTQDPRDSVYFVDILVATDLSHKKLATDIRNGKVKYLSMGCVTDLVICSFCGQKVADAGSYCHHLQFSKGAFLPDDDGVPRRIAELCGHKSLPGGGVRFVEASWVQTPAFPGAVKRSIVSEEWIGPATQYTRQVAASGEEFAKAASENDNYQGLNVGEYLLSMDDGRNLR
jgi:hypothetical protein